MQQTGEEESEQQGIGGTAAAAHHAAHHELSPRGGETRGMGRQTRSAVLSASRRRPPGRTVTWQPIQAMRNLLREHTASGWEHARGLEHMAWITRLGLHGLEHTAWRHGLEARLGAHGLEARLGGTAWRHGLEARLGGTAWKHGLERTTAHTSGDLRAILAQSPTALPSDSSRIRLAAHGRRTVSMKPLRAARGSTPKHSLPPQ